MLLKLTFPWGQTLYGSCRWDQPSGWDGGSQASDASHKWWQWPTSRVLASLDANRLVCVWGEQEVGEWEGDVAEQEQNMCVGLEGQ